MANVTIGNIANTLAAPHPTTTLIEVEDANVTKKSDLETLMLGFVGGKIIIGGTASGEDLTLKSTSHATKGSVIFGDAATTAYDEVNERFGVGTAAPSQKVHAKEAAANCYFYVETDATNGLAGLKVENDAQAYRVEVAADDGLDIVDDTAGVVMATIEAGAPVNSLYVDSSGEVGHGRAPTVVGLDVYDAAADVNVLVNTDKVDGAAYLFVENDAQAWRVGVSGNDDFSIRDNTAGVNVITIQEGVSAEVIRITAAEAVGIGTASIDQKLHVEDAAADCYLKVETGKVNGLAGLQMVNDAQAYRVEVAADDGLDFVDTTAGVVMATIEAGAPVNSIYVDSDGDVGLGRAPSVVGSTRVLDLYHATDNVEAILETGVGTAKAALRLINADQEFRFGLNENADDLRIVDVTGGVAPFVIEAGAPAWSIYVEANGNVGIGTSQTGAVGGKVLALTADGATAPASSVSNCVLLFAEDVAASAELKVRDEAGNVTVLSPHAFELFDKPDPMAWSYHSVNSEAGEKINVDMFSAIKALEELTGKQFIYRKTL